MIPLCSPVIALFLFFSSHQNILKGLSVHAASNFSSLSPSEPPSIIIFTIWLPFIKVTNNFQVSKSFIGPHLTWLLKSIWSSWPYLPLTSRTLYVNLYSVSLDVPVITPSHLLQPLVYSIPSLYEFTPWLSSHLCLDHTRLKQVKFVGHCSKKNTSHAMIGILLRLCWNDYYRPRGLAGYLWREL